VTRADTSGTPKYEDMQSCANVILKKLGHYFFVEEDVSYNKYKNSLKNYNYRPFSVSLDLSLRIY